MSDDEWLPSASSDDGEPDPSPTATCTPSTNVRRSSGRVSRKVNYAEERIDQTFVGRKGYTHFGRTRHGGDCRPNAKPVSMPKEISTRLTLFNFFAAPGKKPLPLPQNKDVATNKPLNRYPKPTRTKWGRPIKKATASDKEQAMKVRVANCKTAGALAVPPQKRRKWNGTVRTNLGILCACTLLLTSHKSYRYCVPCFVFVDEATCKNIDRSVHKGVWW